MARPSLTVPTIHVAGSEIADKILGQADASDVNSVWFDFARDSRFDRQPQTGDSPEILATGFIARQNDGSVDSENLMPYYREFANGQPARTFVAWEKMGLRPILRLLNRRIYVALLGYDEAYDGIDISLQAPQRRLEILFGHDAAHGATIEGRYNQARFSGLPKDRVVQRFFNRFDYELIANRLGTHDRILFDIGYFVYFHEDFASPRFKDLVSSPAPIVSTEEFRTLYAKAVLAEGSARDLKLSPNPELSATVPTSGDLANRFLKKNDLWYLLPIEIRRKAAANPAKKKSIVSKFVGDAMTLFFELHLEATLETINSER